jgi:hypothetical protein
VITIFLFDARSFENPQSFLRKQLPISELELQLSPSCGLETQNSRTGNGNENKNPSFRRSQLESVTRAVRALFEAHEFGLTHGTQRPHPIISDELPLPGDTNSSNNSELSHPALCSFFFFLSTCFHTVSRRVAVIPQTNQPCLPAETVSELMATRKILQCEEEYLYCTLVDRSIA